ALGGVALWAIAGVGFVNYDTLYGLAWGGQLSRGSMPAYEVPIAPTPHPLVEVLGVALAPLGAHGAIVATVALAFLALAGCAWVIYALGARWFGPLAGGLAALIFITRVPVVSYGVRAYVDIPYLLLVLGGVLVEMRRPRAGAPVLALLALAGLLRPEAWAFSGLYWLYLWFGRDRFDRDRSRGELMCLALLAAAAPLMWVLSDLLITGEPLWSLTNTRHTARILDRYTGIGNVPEYIPRRIGEILRPPVLVGAALGGVLALVWLRERARPGAVVGAIAVVVFAAFATMGLPIDTRYAFLASAILCVFCGVGVFGWTLLPRGDRRRRWWMAGGLLVLAGLIAYAPSQIGALHGELGKLGRVQAIEDDLVALVRSNAINLRCGPVGVPNHAPIPLLSLYLKTSPANVVSAQVHQIERGVYVDPASSEVEERYVLDPHDPHLPASVPPGFRESATNRSWLIFKRCE
ncbi:MAG TPA: hypothetical protein VMG62_04690, partial [Solirubrobacteraceae bacterium]|nr:hypothetical protein [Solirubrobacteraceae bacterium]